MSTSLWFGKRVALAILSVYLVLSVMFFLVAFFPNLQTARGLQAPDGSPRDADTSLTDRYVTWMVKYTTLDWTFGSTGPSEASTTDRVWRSLKVTATYLVPAIALSSLIGLVVGLHAAMNRDTLLDRVERVVAYAGFAVPSFFLTLAVLYVLLFQFQYLAPSPYFDPEKGIWSVYNLQRLAPASFVLFVGMVSVQVRHARSEGLRFVKEEFIKLSVAQGASPVSIGRHLLKNAAGGLVSLFVSDLIGVVLLSTIAVETMLKIDGFGALIWTAAQNRDAELVMGVTVVVVVLAVGGSLLQDVVTRLSDPRVADPAE